MENVITNLLAPFSLDDISSKLCDVRDSRFFGESCEFRFDSQHCRLSIHLLRAVLFGLDGDPGRNVFDSDRSFHFIHILPTRSARTHGGDFQVTIGHFHFVLHVLLKERNDVHSGKAGLSRGVFIERTLSHESVRPFFRTQVSVRVPTLHLESRRLQTAALPL